MSVPFEVELVGWVDATGGVSGDMLLGACLDAGVDLAVIQAAIDSLGLPEPIALRVEQVHRAGLGATRAVVGVGESSQRRTLADVLALLDRADPRIAVRAAAVFRALAKAEGRVHQVPADEVHFHEVGALDSIADVVGVVAAFQALSLDRLVCSSIALGGGRAQTQHGPIPVPGPAVVELLRGGGAVAVGGPVEIELATPTGVALVLELADDFGPLPALRPELVGVGAGSKDPVGHANVTRLVIGRAAGTTPSEIGPAVVIETNVDDLDPRLWPAVLVELLAVGASDAWLTPILMKKGRPAHTLSVLMPPDLVGDVEQVVFASTSAIGLRRHLVDKRALPRESVVVDVFGSPVRVKLARLRGRIVNAVPEYDDVAGLAAEQGISVKVAMAAAQVAATACQGTGDW